ncbi:MAG: glycosyltransferase [Acidobacteriaceae bacterium]|nr:glycosyltransferase [Acidobacteriaceae bacterium]MBV8571834.1 glycosyltransferase [Acidobacteriaceae bacterium]
MEASGPAPAVVGSREQIPGISILVPAYGAAEKLETCLRSLAAHAPHRCTVYVLDDATPDDTVRLACTALEKSGLDLRYVRSNDNRGFVATCNWGVATCYEPGHDLLILNSDAEITPGSLEEMQAVLHLHERHAVVTPRSNSATIFSFPSTGDRLPPAESFALWSRLRPLLPRYQLMPTAVGFCMLVKGIILERFDLFDEIYTPGYNEENDFICRINRCGYSALAANWAYVYHHEGASFGARRSALEAAHREILVDRYPEYERKTADYARFHVDPVEVFAHLSMPHRPRILYDCYHLPAKHSGTSEFALNLLREIARLVKDEFDLYVGAGEGQAFFLNELRGYRLIDEHTSEPTEFDLVYKPSQVFTWPEFSRLTRLSPRVAFTVQDIIGVRCDYLSSPDRKILFREATELTDCVFTISDFARSDFAAFFSADTPMRVIHHGTDEDPVTDVSAVEDYILIMGNSFAHKGVAEAVKELEGHWPVVALGAEEDSSRPGVRLLASGNITRRSLHELVSRAKMLVYPSHYEGYGLPVIDFLALGKPVMVLDTQVNREIAGLTSDSNLHSVPSVRLLRAAVQKVLCEPVQMPGKPARRWHDAAQEYVASFREMLNKDIDVPKLRRRWERVRLVESLSGAR